MRNRHLLIGEYRSGNITHMQIYKRKQIDLYFKDFGLDRSTIYKEKQKKRFEIYLTHGYMMDHVISDLRILFRERDEKFFFRTTIYLGKSI